MVIYIVTQVIKVNVTIAALAKHKLSENHLRVRISEHSGWRATIIPQFVAYTSLETLCDPNLLQ